jgi:hypothetical protein
MKYSILLDLVILLYSHSSTRFCKSPQKKWYYIYHCEY